VESQGNYFEGDWVSNAPGKPVSFSRPKVGYFSNRPRTLHGLCREICLAGFVRREVVFNSDFADSEQDNRAHPVAQPSGPEAILESPQCINLLEIPIESSITSEVFHLRLQLPVRTGGTGRQ